jgi:hypothetical protein
VSRGGHAALGAVSAWLLQRALEARTRQAPNRWRRLNHRGREVSLLAGPALAAAAAASSGTGAAGLVAGLGAGAVGAYDDVAGQRADQRSSKGLRGHATALAEGRVTSGAVKVAGIGLSGLLAARLTGRRGGEVVLDGALVAATANLLNLFDVRPGRALKVGLGAALALDAPGPAAAAVVLFPGDLRERTMLGDAGANGLGAVLGLVLTRRLTGVRARAGALACLVILTAASEVVSFSRVIDAVPPLRHLDRLGRLP